MNQTKPTNFDVFNQDVVAHGGYGYTTHVGLSSRLATSRSLEAVLATNLIAGRNVLDLGCGDGFYTNQYWDLGRPTRLAGLDAAEMAIQLANQRKAQRPIEYVVGSAHKTPFSDNSFDVVLVQSILHHDDHPDDMIREAFRLAPTIIIHEPNGLNIGLKIIEKLSAYHRAHGEKSYSAHKLAGWIQKAGGRVVSKKYAGFVPMFCPDGLARMMKRIEPWLEMSPLINACACAVIVIVARRK